MESDFFSLSAFSGAVGTRDSASLRGFHADNRPWHQPTGNIRQARLSFLVLELIANFILCRARKAAAAKLSRVDDDLVRILGIDSDEFHQLLNWIAKR